MVRSDISWAVDMLRSKLSEEYCNGIYINLLLYYADFIAVENYSRHLTWCSYMNVQGIPFNVHLLAKPKVDYSKINDYSIATIDSELIDCVQEALDSFELICRSLDEEKAVAHIQGLCNIIGVPKISPEHMFHYATLTLNRDEKKQAKKKFESDKSSRMSSYKTTYIHPYEDEPITEIGNKYTSGDYTKNYIG